MTITARDIVAIVQHDHDLSPEVAAELVEDCLTTFEAIDRSKIDRDAIDRLDAGFIEIMCAMNQVKARS